MDTVSLINQYSSSLIQFAWTMLWQSSALILILLLLNLLLRKRVKALFRYCLWMLLLAKLVLPVGLALPCSPAYWVRDLLPDVRKTNDAPTSSPLIAANANEASTHKPMPVASKAKAPVEPTPTIETASLPLSRELPADAGIQAPHAPISWQSLVSLGWVMAVMVMLGLLIQRALFVRSLVRQAKPADENLLAQLERCVAKMEMQQNVDLRISPNATSPSVCGLVHPVILMPDRLGDHLDARQIDAILMHELAHIKRADLWVNLVQALLQIVYFYNPLLWIANTVIRRIREQAVDEMVLVAMDERAQDYPETLLTVSRLVWSKPMLSLRLIGVVESKSALSGRINHILSRPFPKSARLGLVGVTAIFITAIVLLPMAKGSLFRKPAIPMDTELSQLPGISLQRVAVKTSSSTTGSSSGGQSHSRRSFKSEQALKMLRTVSKNYPVVLKAKLPKGIFAMSAEVDGDWRMLLEEVCLAFSQSFDLDISIRPYKQKVLVLTCPDPAKLKLQKSDRDVSCGFYKQEDVSDSSAGKRVPTYREKFIVGMDELSAFAARHVLANSDYRLTLVNETNLDGLYEGVLKWSPNREKQIIESLGAMGLKVSKARRTVETVVVSKRDPAKDYTVQADVLGTIRSDLVLSTHTYHPAGQPIHFSLEQKCETRVEFDKLPSMFLKIDGKEYKSNRGSNPYSGGTTSFTSNSIRGKDKPQLTPGKHTVSVLFKDYNIRYKGQPRHIDELYSNECEFEVLDNIPEDYFRPLSIANAKQILDDCHIQMLYLVEPTSDSLRDYSEQMTIKGYTPPFNIAARVYVESESGKKVFVKDLSIVSTVGEVLRNNSFSHSLHKDFSGNESQFSEQDLLRERWRIVLEPSQAVAQTNPMIKRYFAQTYYGPYQDVQMHMNSFRFHDVGFTRTSHNPLSNFQREVYGYLDMDRNRSSKESDGADLIYQTDKNCFVVATHSKVSALKLKKTISLNNLSEQMISAVTLLSSGKGNVNTIDIRDGQLDLYALQSDEGNYFLLTVNGAEHSHNGVGMGGASRYIEHSRYKDLTVEAVRAMKQAETLAKAEKQTNTSSPGETKTALLLPSIRQVLDLSSGKMLDVPLEKKSQAECLAYVNQNCAGGIMFDHDGKLSHLGFVQVAHVSRHTTVQSGIKMMSFLSKNMPQEVVVTAKNGKRYGIQISSAENEGGQITYQQLPDDMTKAVAESSWTELTMPDIDGSGAPAILTLDTHELVAIQDDSDQAAHEQWIKDMRQTPDRSFLLYEHAQNKANLIMAKGIRFLGIDAGPSTRQDPVVQVVSRELPDTFTMTSPDGQVYEFNVLQADAKSCRLRYRPAPSGKTDVPIETDRADTSILAWNPYSRALVSDAARKGRPVIIKFTAEWCTNCTVVDTKVYSDKTVIGLIEDKDVLPILADTTAASSPATKDFSGIYGETHTPLSIYIAPDGTLHKLRGIFDKAELLRLLKSMPEAKAKGIPEQRPRQQMDTLGQAQAGRLSPPIIAHDVKLNFADPRIRDKSFHSKQSVAFALAFINYDIGPTGKLVMSIFGIGQTTWSLHFKNDRITIKDGSKGQEVLSEAWPIEQTKFEKVITLPVKYGQHKYTCPVHIDLTRRQHGTPLGSYWYCAYLSGRLPKGAGRRRFEIVNLDQQMEFRLIGDGTDQRDAVLGIDIDGDGTINAQKTGGEQFDLYEPFQIGSKTYRVTEIDPYMPRVVFREVGTP
jgi:beta-lactamase regulating signal transducer with metallopeptidase domain